MEIKKCGVIGAGQMGGGIIQVFAQSGYDTTVWVRSDASEEKAKAKMEKYFQKQLDKGRISEEEKAVFDQAMEGLLGDYGLQVGKTIRENQQEVFGDDFLSYAMGLTAAASDARMAGCTLPAMSNSGSGNQGITVSMPVIAYALKYKVDDQRLARALILSNLVAIHIKHYLGKLSALCGCVVASTGSACGIVYLQNGGYNEICSAIKNMAGNIIGMVCDGAKVGCAMKVASGVSCAVQSAVLALRGTCIPSTDGIIEDDVEKTIQNIGTIGSAGMKTTDKMILDIMLCK